MKMQPTIKGTVLEQIVAATRERIATEREAAPADTLRAGGAFNRAPLDFEAAIAASGLSVIAEVKLASPSEGAIAPDADPVAIACEYEAAGATALSVLTEPQFFGGSLDNLRRIREAVDLPLLMKDFIVNEYQLLQARSAGADCALLIVAVLGDERLRDLMDASAELDLHTLVEVHTQPELEVALDANARLIGINSRNLHTLDVDLGVARTLADRVQDQRVTLVAESGITSHADLTDLGSHGFDGFLVGTHLVRSGRPGAALTELLGGTA